MERKCFIVAQKWGDEVLVSNAFSKYEDAKAIKDNWEKRNKVSAWIYERQSQ